MHDLEFLDIGSADRACLCVKLDVASVVIVTFWLNFVFDHYSSLCLQVSSQDDKRLVLTEPFNEPQPDLRLIQKKPKIEPDDDDDDAMLLREQLLKSLATKRAAKARAMLGVRTFMYE